VVRALLPGGTAPAALRVYEASFCAVRNRGAVRSHGSIGCNAASALARERPMSYHAYRIQSFGIDSLTHAETPSVHDRVRPVASCLLGWRRSRLRPVSLRIPDDGGALVIRKRREFTQHAERAPCRGLTPSLPVFIRTAGADLHDERSQTRTVHRVDSWAGWPAGGTPAKVAG
jgi:hypothetical protein